MVTDSSWRTVNGDGWDYALELPLFAYGYDPDRELNDTGLATLHRRGLELTAQSQNADGSLPVVSPGHFEDYNMVAGSCYWAVQVTEYHRHTGDNAFAGQMLPAIDRLVSYELRFADAHGPLTETPGRRFLSWADARPRAGLVSPATVVSLHRRLRRPGFLCCRTTGGLDLGSAPGFRAVVPTPGGDIEVRYRSRNGRRSYTYRVPRGSQCLLRLPGAREPVHAANTDEIEL